MKFELRITGNGWVCTTISNDERHTLGRGSSADAALGEAVREALNNSPFGKITIDGICTPEEDTDNGRYETLRVTEDLRLPFKIPAHAQIYFPTEGKWSDFTWPARPGKVVAGQTIDSGNIEDWFACLLRFPTQRP